MTPLTINIIGSGSIGHLWSAHLLEKQSNITLYSRQPASNQQYQLVAPERTFNYQLASETLSDWRPADFIIICVKATDLETLCLQLKTIPSQHSTILLMMNGLGVIDLVEKHLPSTQVFQAATNHGARLDGHQLLHTGNGETLIGDLNSSNSTVSPPKVILPLIKQLNKALPTTRWNVNHKEALWLKLLVNSIINPLTAIHAVSNGQIVENRQINQQAKRLTKQLQPIIETHLPTHNWQSIFETVESVANQTYNNISSMRQDILRGRKTEIDFISGYLIKMATKQQLALPDHEQIVKQVKALENES